MAKGFESLSAWDVAESSSRSNTKQDLERLKLEAIGKNTDNINFSENKTNEKEKYDSFDVYLDDIFDSYLLVHRDSILPIINDTTLNQQQKTAAIQNAFKNFLIPSLSSLPTSTSSEYSQELNKKIITFQDQLNNLKETEEFRTISDTQKLLNNLSTQIQLNQIKSELLTPISSDQYEQSQTSNTTPTRGSGYSRNGISTQQNSDYSQQTTTNPDKKGRWFGKLFGKKDKNTQQEDQTFTNKYNTNNLDSSEYTFYGDDLNGSSHQRINSGTNGDISENSNNFESGYSSSDNFIDDYDDLTEQLYYDGAKIRDINTKTETNKSLSEILNSFGIKEDEEGNTTNINSLTTNLNRSLQNGVAGIINAFRDNPKQINKFFSYTKTKDGFIEISRRKYEGAKDSGKEITSDDIKVLMENHIITYEKKTGISINQVGKIAKILSYTKWEGLLALSTAIASRTDYNKGIKSLRNEIFTAQTLSPKSKGNEVFAYLCDFNSDEAINDQGVKKNDLDEIKLKNKEGDVGNIFGKQLFFTIEQAINTQNVLLESPQGEHLVIFNIIKSMKIEQSSMSRQVKDVLSYMMSNTDACTKTNLIYLLQGKFNLISPTLKSSSDEAVAHGFKTTFISAMEKISGGSQANQADLYDALTGKIIDDTIEQNTSYEAQIRSAFNTSWQKILASNNPQYAEIKNFVKQNSIDVREHLVGQIMGALDRMTIAISKNPNGVLDMAGVSKDFPLQKAKEVFVNNVVQNFINLGLYSNFKFTDGQFALHIPLQYAKESAQGGDRLRRYAAGPGIVIGQDISITLGASGEYAWEYNTSRVINANLDDVRSAKYIGVEGSALVALGKNTTLEASAGLNRTKDPIAGINQIDKQYTDVSNRIFDISQLSFTESTHAGDILRHLRANLSGISRQGKYQEFSKNNSKLLENNINIVGRFLYEEKLLENPAFTKLSLDQRREAIDNLIKIVQSGNREQRRGDLLLNLGKKVDITKLSFGVTTMPLLLARGKSTSGVDSGTPIGGDGVTNEENPITTGNSTNQEVSPGSVLSGGSRFGIGGFYLGMRLSTWKTKYLPNASQILFTDYEIGNGQADKLAIKNLDQYANYLESFFNKKGLSVDVVYNQDNKPQLKISNISKDNPIAISDLINLHYKPGMEQEFFVDKDSNTITIGNISEIGTYTTTTAKGIDRVLCLGTRKLNEAVPLSMSFEDTTFGNNNASGIEFDKLETSTTKTQESVDIQPLPVIDEIKDIIGKTNISQVKDLEKIKRRELNPLFKSFMINSLSGEINKASENLKGILTPQDYKLVKDALTTGDEITKSLIISKFRAIFAYEGRPNETTPFKLRGDTYLNLAGPSGEHFSHNIQQELKTLGTEFAQRHAAESFAEINTSTDSHTDLIGYSAFYRQGLTADAHKYGLGTLGDISVYGGEMMPITNNLEATKQWIIDNIKKEPEAINYLTTKILHSLEQNGIVLDDKTIHENIIPLLAGESIEIENTLDISSKKHNISLEANPVFYFMGECVNESLGLQLGNINIETTTTTREDGLVTYTESHSISSQAISRQKNLTLKGFVAKPEKSEGVDPGKAKPDDTSSDGKTGTPGGDGGVTNDDTQIETGAGGDDM